MRRTVLALAFLIVATGGLAGCKHSGSAKLEGRWHGTRAEGIGADVQDAANAFAMQTEITARGNQITISTPFAKGRQATYVVDEENKTTVVVHTDQDGVANKETFSFAEDGTTMIWRVGEGRAISFAKVKE